MGQIKKGVACSIQGCIEKSIRSFSVEKIQGAARKSGLSLKASETHKVYLCKTHYKQLKKELKRSDEIDHLRVEKKIYKGSAGIDRSRLT